MDSLDKPLEIVEIQEPQQCSSNNEMENSDDGDLSHMRTRLPAGVVRPSVAFVTCPEDEEETEEVEIGCNCKTPPQEVRVVDCSCKSPPPQEDMVVGCNCHPSPPQEDREEGCSCRSPPRPEERVKCRQLGGTPVPPTRPPPPSRPPPSRPPPPCNYKRRPYCIVFDENDPKASLERGFAACLSQPDRPISASQTVFVEHKSVQTMSTFCVPQEDEATQCGEREEPSAIYECPSPPMKRTCNSCIKLRRLADDRNYWYKCDSCQNIEDEPMQQPQERECQARQERKCQPWRERKCQPRQERECQPPVYEETWLEGILRSYNDCVRAKREQREREGSYSPCSTPRPIIVDEPPQEEEVEVKENNNEIIKTNDNCTKYKRKVEGRYWYAKEEPGCIDGLISTYHPERTESPKRSSMIAKATGEVPTAANERNHAQKEKVSIYKSSGNEKIHDKASIVTYPNIFKKMHFWRREATPSVKKMNLPSCSRQSFNSATESNPNLRESQGMYEIQGKMSTLLHRLNTQEDHMKKLHNLVESNNQSTFWNILKWFNFSNPECSKKDISSDKITQTENKLDASDNDDDHDDYDQNGNETENENDYFDWQSDDFGLLCSDMTQPVCNDLVSHVVQIIGQRGLCDIMLLIMLRSDNIYHVNIQERNTNKLLGCILVNHKAIQAAIDVGFFDKVITLSVTDIRNTIEPPKQPIGFPFELIPRNIKCVNIPSFNTDEHNRSQGVYDFITKVLNYPLDKKNR